MTLSDHARANRKAWGVQAKEYEPSGRRHWADDVITWGDWGIPEAELRSLRLLRPGGATTRHTSVTPEWARRWPSEEIWVARLGERVSVVA